MATAEGFGLLGNFSGIFTFLFAFAVIYGVLSITNIFGDKSGKTVNPIIAFSLALMASFSDFFVNTIALMSPWLIMIVVAIFFVLLILRFLGVSESTLENFFSSDGPMEKKTVVYWVIGMAVAVVALTISLQVGDDIGPYVGGGDVGEVNETAPANGDIPTGEGTFADNLAATIFHPKVVGSFLVILFASFAIRQLSVVH